MNNDLPDTINFHFTSICNARCKFCFAQYPGITSECSISDWKIIIDYIASESSPISPKRINFVGGEPTIHKGLPALLAYAKEHELQTSIVTNGLSWLKNGIAPYVEHIDMIGLSIDSINHDTIKETGRYLKKAGYIPSKHNWLELAKIIRESGIDLKINTVVNKLNYSEDMVDFISDMSPKKWKIFQVTRIDGQNDINFTDWDISKNTFDKYCQRHKTLKNKSIIIIKEDSEIMLNSYAIIGPNGCFVDNAEGKYFYSPPIVDVGVDQAWKTIRFNYEAFLSRRSQDIISVSKGDNA